MVLPCISDPIKLIGIIRRILIQSDTVNDLILFVGHCDLYYMVQWFCLISLSLSDRYASHFGYLFYTASDLVSFIGHCDLYFMVQ